jgi:hypothetical protein
MYCVLQPVPKRACVSRGGVRETTRRRPVVAARSLAADKGDEQYALRLFNVAVPMDKDPGKDDYSLHEPLITSVRRKLKTAGVQVQTSKLQRATVVRKAFDARKKAAKRWVCVFVAFGIVGIVGIVSLIWPMPQHGPTALSPRSPT